MAVLFLFLNANAPYVQQVITQMASIMFHPTISAAQGEVALNILENIRQSSFPYILVLEGAIPLDMPKACMIGRRPLKRLHCLFWKMPNSFWQLVVVQPMVGYLRLKETQQGLWE